MTDGMASVINNPHRFYIETPMIQGLHDKVTQWLWCGFTGGLVVGEARTGKTRAVRALQSPLLTRDQEPVSVHRVAYGLRDRQTLRDAWVKLAESIGISVSPRHTAGMLASQIVTFLAESSLSNRDRQVVLFVDECQFLTLDQLNVFAEIYNDLSEAGINGVIIFIANSIQFEGMAKKLLKPEYSYLRERFFANAHEFFGFRKASELKSVLKQFDAKHNGTSMLDSFIDTSGQETWRLSSLTELIWDIYIEEYQKPRQITSWGMEYFYRFIKILIQDYLPHYDFRDSGNCEAMIANSLEASGLNPTLENLTKKYR
ncbi:MAG: ATP-binding protein [Motiliproteus sp.]